MSAPGWYPDPGGQKGMFRYWDGHSWSPGVSPTPNGLPPGAATRGVFDPRRPLPTHGRPPGSFAGSPSTPGRRGWWIGGIATVCALIVLIAFGVRQLASNVTGVSGPSSSGSSDREICPRLTAAPTVTQRPSTRDGRVYGGKLSYPELPPPWSRPSPETRVPFGRDVSHQSVTIERNRNPQYDWDAWVASVLVAELMAGDGFYSPQQGSEIVVKCVIGSFYGNSSVQRTDMTNKAAKVGDKEAWLVESQLNFNIPGLQAKGELLIVLIVATAEGEASLFYASIPDNARQWEQPARRAMADLRVEP